MSLFRILGKYSLRFLTVIVIACTSASLFAEEKIIIDADVGIDDAMAIMFASASPELELLGITTTFGNATIENSTRNALYLIERLGLAAPVVRGSPLPLVVAPEPPADFVHGDNGLGNVSFSDPLLAPADLSAAQFIIEQSFKHEGELTLVPVGRLTNIALALRLDPSLPKRVKRVVLMGGAFDVSGNVTPVAEANIIGDPHAADIVFGADWDLVAIGLDVTMRIVISDRDLAEVEEKNPLAGGFLREICQFYLAFYRSVGLTEGFSVHDPSTLLYLVQPDLFELKSASVRVVSEGLAIGQTIAALPPHDTRENLWAGVNTSQYASSVDSKNARKLFLSRMKQVSFVKQ